MDSKEKEDRDPVLSMGDDSQGTICDELTQATNSQEIELRDDSDMHNLSENLFPESPIYEPDFIDDIDACKEDYGAMIPPLSGEEIKAPEPSNPEPIPDDRKKRKLSEDIPHNTAKLIKMDSIKVPSQVLDEEVSFITKNLKEKFIDLYSSPSTSKIVRSSPRKITKRSNSSTICCDNIQIKSKRSTSVDLTKEIDSEPLKLQNINKTGMQTSPLKLEAAPIVIGSDSSTSSRPSVEFVKEIRSASKLHESAILEESSSHNDSQNIQLALSPGPEDKAEKPKHISNSEPVVVKERNESLTPDKIHIPLSVGYTYPDQTYQNSQVVLLNDLQKNKQMEKSTDQESTDSVGSIILDSPDPAPSMSSKLISKMSNGNSSTPTEIAPEKIISLSDSDDNTPDSNKLLQQNKRFSIKNESFRNSNTTTPSTISPLQNGHNFPLHTPTTPNFDVLVNNDEDGEFLSLYIVRTDNDVGQDMYKEYQRISRRFTIDPYLGDVSKNTSPSSVTSTGMITLPARSSFASTISSSSSGASNRTSDGNFIVPQPPGKSFHQGSTTIKGYKSLIKKITEIFSHIPEVSMNLDHYSSEEKVSAAVQVSPNSLNELSNGNSSVNGSASPEEVNRCDRTTPKSSLKKNRVRGRRPLTGKTKRNILPTQAEEPEYMHGMNSPEMVPTKTEKITSPSRENSDKADINEKFDKVMSPTRDGNEKPLIATPKSVSKLKNKKRPASPKPSPIIEKPLTPKPDIPGYEPGTVVLAKWADKRYYSGKVLEILEPNKYLIEFDDGHTKALLDEFIIFGNMSELPLQGQSVYARITQDHYEPGLVLGIEENSRGIISYRCTTDRDENVKVTANEVYLTEDQAKSIREACPRSPYSAPNTPRRRVYRELDLDNIIQGPRSARGKGSARKRLPSPKSPKASTSGIKGKGSTPSTGRKRRQASESSEISESSNSGLPPPGSIEEVPGVEPEVQKTPRKIDGLKAGPVLLKGAAKLNVIKKNSKLTKFENDDDTISLLGPIPSTENKIFAGLHFLLTYTDQPRKNITEKETKHCPSEEDCDSSAGTDREDFQFTNIPFNKERLKEQLEAGGGKVYSNFQDVPKKYYPNCKLIAPRPCLTAKYIQCLAVDIKSITHAWVISCCMKNMLCDFDAFVLPAGWSSIKKQFVLWDSDGRKTTNVFKDKIILLCGDHDSFITFWEKICTLLGATTRVVNEEDLNMNGALVLVTDFDCPHEVQNKANQDNIPLVSTTWVCQCLIEGRICSPSGHESFSFMYMESE